VLKTEHFGKCLLIKTKKRILVAGDLHIGYEESLEKSGAFVGRKMFGELIAEFNLIFAKIGKVDEIILLGDLKHDFSKLTIQERQELNKLFNYLLFHCKKIIITLGNHDNYLLNVDLKREIEVKDVYIDEEVCFFHGDRDFAEIRDKKIKCWVLGHFHPAILLGEKKRAKCEKYKCFLEGNFEEKRVIILPSFFEGSEGSDFEESRMKMPWKFNLKNFKVLIVGENLEVLDFGKLKSLQSSRALQKKKRFISF
jgi:putative SbcD/Mre11-related phosphoesterase